MAKAKRPPKRHYRKAHKDSSGIWIVNKITDAQTDDHVHWTAPSDSDITITFPAGGDPLGVGKDFLVQAGTTREAPNTVPANSQNKYPYRVYIRKYKVDAQGGSSPEIIIVG